MGMDEKFSLSYNAEIYQRGTLYLARHISNILHIMVHGRALCIMT
jgi:hypothetical protein